MATVPPSPITPHVGPRRDTAAPWPRWIRFLFGLLVLATLGAITLLVTSYSSWMAVDRLHAEVAAEDPHWILDDLLAHRAEMDDANNSALVILKLNLETRGDGLGTKREKLLEGMKDQHVLDADQIAALREWANENRVDLNELKKLRTMPAGQFPLKVGNFPFATVISSHGARSAFRMLNFQAYLQIEDQDIKGAAETCHALLNASRSIGEEPFLVSMLIRFAGQTLCFRCVERALAQAEMSESDLASLQKEVETELEVLHLKKALRGERGAMALTIKNYRVGKVTSSQLLPPIGPGTFLADAVPASLILRDYQRMIGLYNESMAACDLPFHQQHEKFTAIERKIKDEVLSPISLIRNWMPATIRCAEAACRLQASGRSLMTALAAERYRQKNHRWPDSMQTLVDAKLLAHVPLDPFDGAPLRWKRMPDGFVIYSVGRNLKDNGGTLFLKNDFEPDTDIGVRMWDITARRQPPLVRNEDD